MKRLLVLSLLAAAAVALPPIVRGDPDDDFGILKTTPRSAPTAAPAQPARSSLPAGMVPAGQAPAPVAAPNPYPLPADAPSHLICAAAFSGTDGAELARQVCVELRTKYRLSAFIYNRGDEERKKQEDEWQRTKAAYPGVPLRKKTVRIVDNYAVLVVGWNDFKSASEYLHKIKSLPLPKLELPDGRSAYEVLAYLEVDPKTGAPKADKSGAKPKQERVNPYHSAMVTRNPLAPSQAARPKVDPFWKELNEGEEYSLLRNRGKYTLVVKEYVGMRSFAEPAPQKRTDSVLEAMGSLVGLNAKPMDMLDAAAAQAHEAAKLLRTYEKNLGFKAFVLHTRNSSLLTIGEFNGPDDPAMQRAVKTLGELKFGSQKGATGKDPLGLMSSPVPFEVPRP